MTGRYEVEYMRLGPWREQIQLVSDEEYRWRRDTDPLCVRGEGAETGDSIGKPHIR